MIAHDSKVQGDEEEEESACEGRGSEKRCSNHPHNQIQNVKYAAVKAAQLVASATRQVGDPTQALVQFLEKKNRRH
jgi:hypothetical protein